MWLPIRYFRIEAGFKNSRNYVCERHFEGYFRTISGLKFDGCHHPTLCIIPTVEYVKKILGYVKQKSKKTIFESAPWTVDFIKLIICGGCHPVTVSAFRFLNFGIRTKDTKMTKFITYRNVPKIFEILNFWKYNFYSSQDFESNSKHNPKLCPLVFSKLWFTDRVFQRPPTFIFETRINGPGHLKYRIWLENIYLEFKCSEEAWTNCIFGAKHFRILFGCSWDSRSDSCFDQFA